MQEEVCGTYRTYDREPISKNIYRIHAASHQERLVLVNVKARALTSTYSYQNIHERVNDKQLSYIGALSS